MKSRTGKKRGIWGGGEAVEVGTAVLVREESARSTDGFNTKQGTSGWPGRP